jgi:uncharacterized protein YndB with AHSA1/START domain
MTETLTANNIVVERTMPHPPEKVWRALTQSALIADWLMANDFEPVVGRKFNFRAPANPHWNGVTDCEVLEVEPQRRLVYTWNSTGEQAGLETTVTWTLTPADGGTQVRMEQSGFRPEQEQNRRGAEFGFTRFLEGLERVAGEKG